MESDLYGFLKLYLEITFSLMKVLKNGGKNVFTDEITLQFAKDLGNVSTYIKRQQYNRLSLYEILGECGNKLSLKKEFRAFVLVKSELNFGDLCRCRQGVTWHPKRFVQI